MDLPQSNILKTFSSTGYTSTSQSHSFTEGSIHGNNAISISSSAHQSTTNSLIHVMGPGRKNSTFTFIVTTIMSKYVCTNLCCASLIMCLIIFKCNLLQQWWFPVWLHQSVTSLWRSFGQLFFIASIRSLRFATFIYAQKRLKRSQPLSQAEVWITAAPPFFKLEMCCCARDRRPVDDPVCFSCGTQPHIWL